MKRAVIEVILFVLVIFVFFLGAVSNYNSQKVEIEHLRKGVEYLHKVTFYEAETPEPHLSYDAKKFILGEE